ncbi:hypothetical protein [Rhizobium rhizosphaerae]|uniref:hypothetical protein n=1 Tax=Xaviernesmea rhizosphaerae TaxID=1672749 RepID=UPI001117FB2D|nr:hypothetical protein [Xaviernesmea rhizosphaerae]
MKTDCGNRFLVGHTEFQNHVFRGAVGNGYAIDVCRFEDLSSHDWDRYDCIVPLSLADYNPLRRIGARLAGKAIYPTASAVAVCDDKYAFNRVVSNSPFGVMIPRLIADVSTSPFPCILKRRHDHFGVESFVLRCEGDVLQHARRLKSDDYFLQEYIEGKEEYATHILLRDGEIVFSFNVLYEVVDQPFVKGKRQHHLSMKTAIALPFLKDFLKVLDYIGFRDGTCCLDYKISNGTPRIFEINPRFGWSLFHDFGAYLRSYREAAQGWTGASAPTLSDPAPLMAGALP